MQPASFTTAPSGPDAPEGPQPRCEGCNGFLPRYSAWEYEDDIIEDDNGRSRRVIAWFFRCRRCGQTAVYIQY